MPLLPRIARASAAATICLLIASCGGGGGGGSSPPPAPTPPPPPPPPAAQTIAFANGGPVAKTYGDAAFTNAASGGAGTGAITYLSGNTAVATVDANGQVTIAAAGTATISANKAADAGHLAASANYTLNVAQAAQSISFATAGPVTRVFGDAPFGNVASGGGGSGAITYSSGSTGVATVAVSSGLVTPVATGTVTITATKAADSNYLAAQANFTLTIGAAPQTVVFANAGPLARTYGDVPFTNAATATGGASSLSYSSSVPSVAMVNAGSGQVTIVGAGSAEIFATKPASANYATAQASYLLTVARAAQSISFAVPGPISRREGDAPFTNVASGGAGSGAITYSSNNSATAAVDATGGVTVGLSGSALITASKAASANHLAAQASYTVNVAPAAGEQPFISWLSLTNPSEVHLPAAAAGADFRRALAGNCPDALSTSCVAITTTTLGPTSFTDTVPGLGRDAQAWLRRGSSIGRPVLVTARHYRETQLPVMEFGGQIWMVGANDGAETWSSTDGRAWLQRSSNLPWGSRWSAQVVLFNNRFYFIGGTTPFSGTDFNDVWSSDNGIDWTRLIEHAAFSERGDHQVVVFNNRLWLIGGIRYVGDQRFNDVWSSSDGMNWTQELANAPFAVRRSHRVVVFNGRLWVFGGSTAQYDTQMLGDAWSSADGVNWRAETALPFGGRRQMATLVMNGRLYLMGGWDGTQVRGDTWSTNDGSNWVQEAAGAPFGLRASGSLLPYRNRVWLIGGADALRGKNDSWTTTNFKDWSFEHTSAPFAPERPGKLVPFNGKLWLLGPGRDGRFQAWSSSDGDDWSQSLGAGVIPARTQFAVAVYNNRLWIQGGYVGTEYFDMINDVWSTADGVTWTQAVADAPFESRVFDDMFAINGKLFMLGGYVPGVGFRNDVWSSTDGATWQREVQFAPFGPLYYHQVAAFNGRAWLIGGLTNNNYVTQIWSSADGVTWRLDASGVQVTQRTQHRIVVHNNLLWIIGGENQQHQALNDSWYSPDGITWTQVIGFSFSPRENHGLASFAGKMWLYGGDGPAGESDAQEMIRSVDGTDWRTRYQNRIEVP